MKVLSKWQFLTLFVANSITLNACSNSNAEKTQNANNTVQQKTETTKQQPIKKNSSTVQVELDNAKKAGKAVFVVVTGTGVTNIDKATEIAKSANAIYKNAVIVQMNRDDAANAQLVTEWRLAGAPLPLILVLSSKGQPTGGYILEQATAENIAALVPSPKLEEVYTAIGKSKNAIVVFSKKSFTDRAEVIKIAKEAVSLLNNEAVFIEVDMEDQKETGFMQQLRISPLMSKSSVTLVINKQGQVAGTSTTVPDANKLVAAAKAPVKSGCGPGCGPAGCGK
jgi:uncharacterized protein YbaA (DUF1428 family)